MIELFLSSREEKVGEEEGDLHSSYFEKGFCEQKWPKFKHVVGLHEHDRVVLVKGDPVIDRHSPPHPQHEQPNAIYT